MSLDKLIRRKRKAEFDNNQQQLAIACHNLGNWYHENQQYDDALDNYREEASIYTVLSLRMEEARAHRMIGEMFMLLENFEKALEHELIYLRTAKERHEEVEEQRALATIGRVYLLRAQSDPNADEYKKHLRSAEKSFLESLLVCKKLTHLPNTETLDMKARLFLNLGVTYECKGEYDLAIKELEKAMTICRHNDFWELLQQCYQTTGNIYANKLNDVLNASRFLNLAINTAERLSENRTVRLCQTLQSKSELFIIMSDFYSAKKVLYRAYKLKTPDESDRLSIEKNLKIVAKICHCEDELKNIDSQNFIRRKVLYETIGDGLCRLKNYNAAIGYYKKMLDAAIENEENEKQLIPIYVSLYQTYKDVKDYTKALEFMWKEYEISKDIPTEAYSTLIGIATTFQLAGKDFWEIDSIYDRAKAEAKKISSKRKEREVIQAQIVLCEKNGMDTLATSLKDELEVADTQMKNIVANEPIDDDEISNPEESSEEINTPDIGDDVCLSELSDSESDGETKDKNTSSNVASTSNAASRSLRRRSTLQVKKNEKGESQLHRSCISGNLAQVRRFIDQGHPVNVRDNAGWTPLHEAANQGHKEIVELLLDNGAWINDKEGTNIDGFTPLHDACGNGLLEIVEVLLDRGANATLKNDLGMTPMQTLELWRKNTILSQAEQDFYKQVHNRLKVELEKSGMEIATNNSPIRQLRRKTKSLTPRKRIIVDTSSEEDIDNSERIQTVDDIINDEFPSTECIAENDLIEYPPSPVYEPNYREVMFDLRRGNFQRKIDGISDAFKTVPKITRRPGILDEEEVSDGNRIDDDLGPSRKKRRTLPSISESTSFPRTSSTETKITSTLNRSPCINDDEENSSDAFDILMKANTNVRLKKRRSSSSSARSINSEYRHQPSLFENGFSKHRMEASESSVSSTVVSPQKVTTHISQLAPIPMPASTLSIKVKVERNLLNVPVNGNISDDLTIEWLAEEAAKRYYNLKGMKPILQLTTADGAIFENSDQLSVALVEVNPLASTVLEWKVPPLNQRYLEACAQTKIDADSFIQTHLDLVESTQSLTIHDQIIAPKISRPMFRSIHFQSNLTTIDLSNCFLEDEGIKQLSQALPTIGQLNSLILSGNLITSVGIRHLSSIIDKENENNNILSELSNLDLSFNPLQNQSLSFLSKFCRKLVQLRSLNLSSTELSDLHEYDLNYGSLVGLNLSLNDFTCNGLTKIIGCLNSCKLISINFSYCFGLSEENSYGFFDCLIKMLSDGTGASLEEVHLDGCRLSDTDCWRLTQALQRSKSLRYLSLRDNIQLTKITWKFLLENIHINTLRLEGCHALITDLNHIDVDNVKVGGYTKNIYLSLSNCCNKKQNEIELLTNQWNIISSNAGRIFKQNSRIWLTIQTENVPLNEWEMCM